MGFELGVLFTYALTAYGCLGTFWVPIIGPAVYMGLSVLKPRALWFWAMPGYRYAYYVAVAGLVAWLIDGFGETRHMGRMKFPLFCLIGFGLWQWISGTFGPIASVWNDFWMYYHCEKITNDVLMVLVAVMVIRTFKELRLMTYVILLCTGYLAYEMNYAYVVQDWNRLWIREFAGIDNNGMAMIFAMVVPLGVCLAAYEKNWIWKGIALAPVPLNIHAIEFSMSRTGMLGVLACIPPLGLLMPRKLRSVTLLTIVTIGGLAMAGPSVRRRFSSIFLDKRERDASANSRLRTWAAGWKCMKANPWMGVGPRMFPQVAKNYGLGSRKAIHNLFLQVGADTGFPGMLLMIGMYGGTMWALLHNRKIRARYSPWYPYWVAMIITGLVSMSVSGQFIGMERVEVPYYLVAIGLSAIKVALREQEAALHKLGGAEPEGQAGTRPALTAA